MVTLFRTFLLGVFALTVCSSSLAEDAKRIRPKARPADLFKSFEGWEVADSVDSEAMALIMETLNDNLPELQAYGLQGDIIHGVADFGELEIHTSSTRKLREDFSQTAGRDRRAEKFVFLQKSEQACGDGSFSASPGAQKKPGAIAGWVIQFDRKGRKGFGVSVPSCSKN